MGIFIHFPGKLDKIRPSARTNENAVGFDSSLFCIYFPTSLQDLTEHTGVQPTGEIQGERVLILLL